MPPSGILLPGAAEADHPLYARSGWRIPTETTDAPASALIEIRARDLMARIPNLRLRSVSDHPYNCVGMIFAARRAWIDIDHIDDLLREDGYRAIPFDALVPGDLALYRFAGEPAHIALVTFIDPAIRGNVWVISKWGKDAEFYHPLQNVPQRFGTADRFYTERV
jgi:hypothetical protein